MRLLEIFVRRRIGTLLLAIGLVLVGMVAYFSLPVAPLPQVDFPTIQVEARLPGASADTMASSVATPLERAFSDISSVTQMTSSSSLGLTQITLQFDLNRNIDAAAQDVQTAINAAGGSLPKDLPNPPTYEKSNPADFTILSLALTSDTLPLTEVDRYAEDFIAPQIAQMPGVGLVDFHGQLRPAVRVRLDPDRLTALGLTLDEVRGAIGTQTVNSPKGSLNGLHQSLILNASDQLMEASAYKSMVVAYRNGAPIRLSDVGTALDAPENIHEAAWLQDKRAVIIDIHKLPGSNVVDTIRGIEDRLPELTASLPPAAKLHVVGDRTQTIRASVNGVQVTMIITIILVVLVIFAFLRDLRTTLIPSLTIPLSLIATFAVMYLLGYSLDNVSLMGLTIAVGFVVDDAIVVIENVTRHLELGKTKLQATIEAVGEIGFTIVSMTVSLIAVFIPILLMGGIVGRLFREFAVCVSVAVAVSGILSLTVTPMLCAWLIDHRSTTVHGRLYIVLQNAFDSMLGWYANGLDRVLRHPALTMAVMLATLVATLWLYDVAPKGLFPQQDTGLIIGVAKAAPDISFDDMADRIQRLGHIVMGDPDVANVYYWIGESGTLSQGRMLINLKPFEERKATAAQVMARLKRKVAGVEDIALFMQVRQDIQVGGRISATQYQYTLQDAHVSELNKWSDIMVDKLSSLPELRDVTSDAEASAASATLQINRDTTSRFGVTAQAIDDVLYDAFGQRQVATLFTQLNQYHVIEEVDPRFQLSTDALEHLYVRSSPSGQLVPLSLLATVENSVSPVSITHQGLFPSVTLSFNLAPGYALGDAITAIRGVDQAIGKPDTVIATFQGTAQVFQGALKSQPWLILAAIIAVYIVLGVLYESAVHPLTIISSLPSAGVGALLALILCGQDLSIMGMIGIVLLIGIVKKNAIMMIDFALAAEREQGLSPTEAIRQGCLLRFRPIMMTTMSALLGALPLALGTGAGAELRRPLGIAIVGGLLVSQVLTLYTTPVVYLAFDRMAKLVRRVSRAGSHQVSQGLDSDRSSTEPDSVMPGRGR
jgi:multidrug efflux pump